MQLTVIYEYGRPGSDWMHDGLCAGLAEIYPGVGLRSICGLSRRYRPGGVRFQRLLSLIWVYFQIPCHFLWFRPKAVIVRSTPPGAQVWAAFWGTLFRIPVFCWMMDYHPEIEARWLERRGWVYVAVFLRRLDRAALLHLKGIVVLDQAAAELIRERAPAVPVAIHPPWGHDSVGPLTSPSRHVATSGIRRLAYAGNLGVAHPLRTLMRLLATLRSEGKVELHFIGADAGSVQNLTAAARVVGVAVMVHDRVPFRELGAVFDRLQIDLGVVLLADEAAGLVSPSKYTGYISFGRPVLYIGPTGTNAHEVAAVRGAGFALQNEASPDTVASLARAIWSDAALRDAWGRVSAAHTAYTCYDGHSAARQFAEWLPLMLEKACAHRRRRIRT